MNNLIKGETGDWEVVIGIEVHAQIVSNSKLFSSASTKFGGEHNTQVSFVDAGMPGMLPVINWVCVEQAIRTGLGLNAKINNYSIFDRKNYFYPDLPQGYQISQFKQPIVGEGSVTIDIDDKKSKTIRIERLHLEQDAGKSLHDQHPEFSFVDLNRSGVALMEIVSMPDISSADEAQSYIKKLRSIMRYLGTCDGNMEEGSLRADINVSVRKPGDELGTRCEIKNVNSIKFIGQAIDYEARRQIELIEDSKIIDQETRLFDPKKGETRSMRSKEEAHDYRYFPDPDLLPLSFSENIIEEIKSELPELPDDKKERFQKEYSLSPYDSNILVSEIEIADFFEAVTKGRDPKIAANWITGEFFAAMNKLGFNIVDSPITIDNLSKLIKLIEENIISTRIAKDVFEIMLENNEDPEEIVEREGLKQVSDSGELEKIIDNIIANNPDQVEAVKLKPKLIGWFVGQVMKETNGKANPKLVNDLLNDKLN
ncbi:MAG: Asp-tRNA(Asn)/Glu-tRNA(Gln) amidotransferase subunit GatB [Hyphomicrobiales bacterium]|jgi:aspartyl-tRNA(Asn)/glutamyl-tRNA(Gln) amidotransferase subunit B|nr:Asp-tRNA(Asn)/Glu-tRNA(Gln) amidotransferase subunit GatB [Hyphomicrobiales bacterium]